MIRTENLTKKYGGLVAVKDLNLDLPQGQFFAFLGPNGAGKTTTIKLLAGLLKPTAGRAFVGGFDIQKDPIAARRIISFVPDTPFLYDKLEPMEFMLFVGQLYGMERAEVVRASDELFDLFDLDNNRKQLIENLSHGTRQRLVIASALLHEPKVIIIDEPLIGLDPRSARVVKNVLKKRSRAGVTVFLSTHLLSIAEELADQVGILNQGELIAIGSIDELRQMSGQVGALEDAFLALTRSEKQEAIEPGMSAIGFFRLLGELNARMMRRHVLALREKSYLMVSVITLFVIGYWVAGYAVFRLGFGQLEAVPGLQAILLDRMLYLFFAFLFVMLVFSNMIIGYSTIFKSQETQWMLTLPVRSLDVFRWKLLETTVLASWAFLFLSAPLMLAYGVTRHVTSWFYLKVFLLFVPFMAIPAALGSLVILVVARYLHRHMFKWALFGLSAVGIACAIIFLKPMQAEDLDQAQMVAALQELLHNSRVTAQPILPSYWVASSMIAWGEGGVGRGTFFFMVLLSNAMMATLVCTMVSRRLFYEGWSHNHSQGHFQSGVPVLDTPIMLPRTGLLERLVNLWPGLDRATRAMVIKDVRVFWRDTSQWSQFAIFFGLLGLYVLNLRSVAHEWKNDWACFISFLNLGASSMTLATLTTRFVFPQFSLEGKRLWMVGMVPYGLKRVLLEKFWLSSICSAAITLALILTSSWMLRIPHWLTLLFSSTVVVMSFALCGIAVGIGALFPSFGSGASRRDDNPAKIVSGFGGTFCFVMSLMYIALVIGAEILPMYSTFTANGLTGRGQPWNLVFSWIFVSVFSLAAACIPMSLALKKVESLEI